MQFLEIIHLLFITIVLYVQLLMEIAPEDK
jgi:hypothetical protein